MRADDRENKLYRSGKRCLISIEEKKMMELLQSRIDAGARILDVGCGSGEVTKKLLDLGYRVEGVDFSEVAISLAKEKDLTCQVVDVDRGLPFKDNIFDAVWAGDVIEHVFDPIFVLSEINRVTKPGGSLFATIPYDLNIIMRIKMLLGISYQEGVYKKYGQFKHHTFFSEKLMRYMYETASLEIDALSYVLRLPKSKITKIVKGSIWRPFSYLMIVVATKCESNSNPS